MLLQRRYVQILRALVLRELQERYSGAWLGWLWVVLRPLAYLLVFTFVFGVVFKTRWGLDQEEGTAHFALVLFCGLAIYNFLADCIIGAPQVVLRRATLVKQVVFPLALLPLVAVGAEIPGLLVSLLIVLGVAPLLGIWPSPALLWLPLLLLALWLLVAGLVWFLAATGVYVRDLSQGVAPLMQLMLFLSPVFYPLEAVPEPFRDWMRLNPLTPFLETVRGVLLFGEPPGAGMLLGLGLISALVAWLGFVWFQRVRKGFADVL